jgi:hypothetical protein
MTRALGTPHRGQTMPEVGRLGMVTFSLALLDYGIRQKGAKTAQVQTLRGLAASNRFYGLGLTVTCTSLRYLTGFPSTVAGTYFQL